MGSAVSADAPKVLVKVGDHAWYGDVAVYSGGHVRLRLRPGRNRAWPQWDVGASAECVIYEDDEPFVSDGTVLQQDGPMVWLQMPPTWTGIERRNEQRAVGGFRVWIRWDRAAGSGTCLDLSPSGMRILTRAEVPARATVNVSFHLPGDPKPIHADGVVLRIEPGPRASHVELCVKMVSMTLIDSVRLACYCAEGGSRTRPAPVPS